MVSDPTSRRVPWIALALSLSSAGVGHMYCGRITKGLPLYFAWLLLPICLTIAALLPPSPTLFVALAVLPVVVIFILYLYAAMDSWRLASRIGSNHSLRDYNSAAIYALLIVVQIVYAVGLIAGVRSWVYEAFLIPSSSMSPTFLPGDRILVRKLLSHDHFPNRGDLIAYNNPTSTGATTFVGRVVAIAGDHLEIHGERVVINGKELERDRIPDERLSFLGDQLRGRVAMEVNSGHRYLVAYGDTSDGRQAPSDFEAIIPDHHAFVLADNRDRANDSRRFGTIRVTDILGYVEYIYWPSESWSRFGVASDRLP